VAFADTPIIIIAEAAFFALLKKAFLKFFSLVEYFPFSYFGSSHSPLFFQTFNTFDVI